MIKVGFIFVAVAFREPIVQGIRITFNMFH